jgi:hypothetical protein
VAQSHPRAPKRPEWWRDTGQVRAGDFAELHAQDDEAAHGCGRGLCRRRSLFPPDEAEREVPEPSRVVGVERVGGDAESPWGSCKDRVDDRLLMQSAK